MQIRISSAVFLLTAGAVFPTAAQTAQIPLAGSALPQFVDPLPIPTILDGTTSAELHMREFRAAVLPSTFVPANGGPYQGTTVWGYVPGPNSPAGVQPTYIGPVILAQRNIPTEIKYVNDLGYTTTSQLLAWTQSTDLTLHWADPLNNGANTCAAMVIPGLPATPACTQHYAGSIPAVTHLHGGAVPPQIDGGPNAWFTSDGLHHGPTFYSGDASRSNYAVYRYPNTEPAAPLWIHDHTLGATRLNVYAGLAGAYLLMDAANDRPDLPSPTPLVIQDRSFDVNGELFYPAGVPFVPNPEHPYWVPEFLGDTIVVNGKAWPYVNVEPRRQRFIFVNGSNARAYEMSLAQGNAPPMWQIATDGGYLDTPVRISPVGGGSSVKTLLLMPGERADVIIDFAGLAPGTTLLLRNTAKAPFPDGDQPRGSTLGRIVQFRVVAPTGGPDTTYDPATGAPLRTPMVRLVDPATGQLAPGVTVQKRRALTLNEVLLPGKVADGIAYPGGPLEVLLNNTSFVGETPRPYDDFVPVSLGGHTYYFSELPQEGDTEVWELINLTADAHPIHLHLVQFQLQNRQEFDVRKYGAAYDAAFPGGPLDPLTGLPYPEGEYIPGFGPPLDYQTGNPEAVGGNPPVTEFLKKAPMPPPANEAGWKDTIIAYPGQVTRLAVRWAPSDLPAATPPADAFFPFNPSGGGGYVWHCHILEHEDNDMMRPTGVQANPNAVRSLFLGEDY